MKILLPLIVLVPSSSLGLNMETQDVDVREKRSELSQIPIDFTRLVSSLKNANKKPRIVGGWEVRFGDDYNFGEQRRIFKAIRTLQEYAEEAWPQLVSNLNNSDYSLTFGFGEASRNYTVGQVCEQVVRNALYVFNDRCGGHVEGTNVKMSELKDPELPEVKQLVSWLAERKDKSLLELQLELADNLKRRIPSLDLPGTKKAMFIQSTEEHVRYLKRRGFPESGYKFIPNRETWWYFTREDATRR